MKQLKKWLVLIMAAVIVLSAGQLSATTAQAKNESTSTDDDTVTYTYSDATFLKYVENENNCTSMQGMVATEDYLYVVKIKGDNTQAIIVQYDVKNGTSKTMTYYPDFSGGGSQL